MATENMESLERIVECPVCHEQLQEPIMLECGHSFCKECLKKMILPRYGQVVVIRCPCPLCRKDIPINCQLTVNPNLIAKDIVDFLKTSSNNQPSSSSGSEGSNPKYSLCKTHPSIEQKYVCLRCKVDVCSDCWISDHFAHDKTNSKPMKLDDMKQFVLDLLSKSDSLKADYDKRNVSIEKIRMEGEQHLDNVKRALYNSHMNCLRDMELAHERMNSELDEEMNRFSREIDELLENNKKVVAEESQTSSCIRKGLKRGTPADVIDTYISKWAKQSFNPPSSSETDDVAQASSKLDEIKLVQFEQGTASMEEMLGRVVFENFHNASEDDRDASDNVYTDDEIGDVVEEDEEEAQEDEEEAQEDREVEVREDDEEELELKERI